ncbi:MAG TPA: aminoglycoside phosphotransferase family protein [Caulobacteraceae bacterium]|nr:aminoglycoside phosphotransferase family protein [Caulobacteraceae bacterium]
MREGPDQDEVVASLRRLGLVAAGETPLLQPLAGGVSADVFLTTLRDGRRMAVKRSIPRLRVQAEWLASPERMTSEVRWLRFVHHLDPDRAPAVIADDPVGHVVVMAWLDPDDHPVWKDELAAGRVSTAFAAAVGTAFGQIHRSTAGDAAVAAAFPDRSAFFDLRISPFLLWPAERAPRVSERLRELAARLETARIALTHGDMSPKNILVGPHGPVFLDAETCVFGDPAFDLAFCLTHLLLKTVWLKPHREALDRAFDALLEAYAVLVDWERVEVLRRRAGGLISALLLARVEGKSPAPYLVEAQDRGFVADAAVDLLGRGDIDPADLAQHWRRRWTQAFAR